MKNFALERNGRFEVNDHGRRRRLMLFSDWFMDVVLLTGRGAAGVRPIARFFGLHLDIHCLRD